MSDVLNANPTVYDVSLMPSRRKNVKADDDFTADSLNLYNLSLDDSAVDLDSLNEQVSLDSEDDNEEEEEIDLLEIYDLIASISDPEHPLTLAALGVVNLKDISISYYNELRQGIAEIVVKITPTISHCSLATLIGLGIRVRLERCLPPRFRIRILLKEGSHQSENLVNKQLNDKERISAACENSQLLSVISTMLATCT